MKLKGPENLEKGTLVFNFISLFGERTSEDIFPAESLMLSFPGWKAGGEGH